jgi:hypothetical protein
MEDVFLFLACFFIACLQQFKKDLIGLGLCSKRSLHAHPGNNSSSSSQQQLPAVLLFYAGFALFCSLLCGLHK